MSKMPTSITFAPIFKETVWGGRKLFASLRKNLPKKGTFGESWEIVDLPSDQSRTEAGQTLEQLCRDEKEDLLGNADLLEGRFPLLFKFIDAGQTLSVQVHPDEAACAKIGDARPKTEAWYIIDREPGALLYVGLIPGVTKDAFESSVIRGDAQDLLHKVAVEPGDFIYLPSGTVHAIGEGILLAEVQQSSDTTYRVFDWNRVGLDGKPRDLHVQQALASIHFGEAGVPPIDPPSSGRPGIRCRDFEIERISLSAGEEVRLEGEGPLITMALSGAEVGKTVLYPAVHAAKVLIRATEDTDLLATRIPSPR